MEIKARIDKVFKQLEIHVCNKEMNEEVSELLEELKKTFSKQLMGTDEKGNRCILAPGKISRFYAQGQKVFAQDEEGVYSVSKKLYELEESMDASIFIRISKSEIINIRKIKRLDMSVTGTIKVIMLDGTETYTSRRNVTRLKKALL